MQPENRWTPTKELQNSPQLASPNFTSHQTNKPSSYCASTQHFGAMVNIGLALLKRKEQQNLQMYMPQCWKNTPILNHIQQEPANLHATIVEKTLPILTHIQPEPANLHVAILEKHSQF
jgi:hypothetical protein